MGNTIEAWFDGVTEPVNPGGYAAYGVLVKVDGEIRLAEGKFVGRGEGMSNNLAEYSGFCAAVDYILNQNLLGIIVVRGDSKLVICQLAGDRCADCKFKKWAAHGGLYLPLHNKAKYLLSILQERTEGNVALEWIPREQNSECDRYSKKVLTDMGIKLRIQPETFV